MRAAARCAAGDGPPPAELEAWWACGGHLATSPADYLAQPAGYLRRVATTGQVYDVWRAYLRESHKATWMAEHPHYRPLVKQILEALKHEPHH